MTTSEPTADGFGSSPAARPQGNGCTPKGSGKNAFLRRVQRWQGSQKGYRRCSQKGGLQKLPGRQQHAFSERMTLCLCLEDQEQQIGPTKEVFGTKYIPRISEAHRSCRPPGSKTSVRPPKTPEKQAFWCRHMQLSQTEGKLATVK